MPRVTFFTLINERRQNRSREYITLGRWRFYEVRVEVISHLIYETMRVIGYNVTYENIFITQEETDEIMKRVESEKHYFDGREERQ